MRLFTAILLVTVNTTGCIRSPQKVPLSIHDLVILSPDIFLAVEYPKGISITKDGGKSWRRLTNKVVNEVTVDESGIFWALFSWKGIHEPSYSAIYSSIDSGNTWKTVFEGGGTEFPTKIISEPFERLKLLSNQKRVFILEYKEDSISLSPTDAVNIDPDLSDSIYHIDGSVIIKHSHGRYDSLVNLPNLTVPFDLKVHEQSIYVVGRGYGGYKGIFIRVVGDSIFREVAVDFALYGLRRVRGKLIAYGSNGILDVQQDSLVRIKDE